MNLKISARRLGLVVLFALAMVLCLMNSCVNNTQPSTGANATAAEAEKFIDDAEKRLLDLNLKYQRADWVKSTYITQDTEELSAEANKDVIAATTELAEQATRFERLDLKPDVQLSLIHI